MTPIAPSHEQLRAERESPIAATLSHDRVVASDRSANPARPSWLIPHAAVAVPIVACLASGLIEITRPQMWRDELVTWSATTRSPGQLWRLLHHQDAVHGLYYLLMHYWISLFGDSPLAMRLPSTLATAGAAGCVALLGRRIGGDKLAITAGLLYALMPVTARYAQEARSYAFMTLAVTLATLLLDHAIDNGRRRTWWGYTVAVIFVGAFNLVALTILVGHFAYVVRRSASARTWRSLAASLTAAAIVLAPLAYVGGTQSSQLAWVSRPTFSDLVHVGPQMFATAFGAGAILMLAIAGWCRSTANRYALVSMAVLPTVSIWLASQGHTHYFLSRYLLFTTPIWALAAARAIADARLLRIAAALVGLLIVIWPDQAAVRTPTSHEAVIYSGAAAEIAHDARPGDAIVFARSPSTLVDIGVRYYLKQAHPRYLPTDVWLGPRGPITGEVLDRNATDTSSNTVSSHERIWLIVPGNPADPFVGLTAAERATLTSAFQVSKRFDYVKLTLTLLQRS